MGKSIFDTIGNAIGSAIAVPKDIVTGNFDKLPGDIFNNAVAGVSNVLAPGVGSSLGLGSLGGSLLGGVANSAGSALGSSLFGSGKSGSSAPSGTPAPAPFTPKQQGSMSLPPSLSQFGSLDPSQQTSNIATQGVYGGGAGPEESKYFLNLINRRLVDPSGKVGDLSSVSPVEGGFLNQLGLGGYSNSKQLLKNIKGYSAA